MLRATTVELVDGLVATSLRARGRLERRADTSRFDHRYTHVDVLVVGGGPAGIAAAVAAGRTGARVLLVDDARELGGSLRSMPEVRLDGRPGLGVDRGADRGDDTPPGDADPDPRDRARAI